MRAASKRLRRPSDCAAIDLESQLLVVLCDVDDSQLRHVDTHEASGAARVADRLQCDFVGPLDAANPGQLSEALARVKQSGRSTVLYVDARTLQAPAPHFAPVDRASDGESTVGAGERLRDIASGALATLAANDRRIAVYSADDDSLFKTTAESSISQELPLDERVPMAIDQCASLAARGGKPFLFMSADEVQNHLGRIRREICLDRRGVTLVIEARRAGAVSEVIGSASLSGIRHLPDISLLAPKDGTELCQMLTWCVDQADPAVIWLSEQWEPPVHWPPGDEIVRGRAERLGKGTDVTIIAWGSQAAAAAIAAENLAQQGIVATVVNARFAQPLDVETLARACSDAAYLVIVDDAPAGGGFAGWVSEQLVRRGVVQSITIVSSANLSERSHSDDPHDQLASHIVDRCRWLSEPMFGQRVDPEMRVVSVERPVFPSYPVARIFETAGSSDVQQQILAQQFSPFIQRWVERYALVGSRDVYLWRWCLHGLGLTTLSCVPVALRHDLCDTKLLAVMYGVMLDDVADQAGGDEFLAALIGIIAGESERNFGAFSSEQQEYARFTCDLWDTFRGRLECSPCYQEYAELLDYDHRQILNTFAYSCMVNKHPALLNVQEHDMYMPHNMQMMSFATMDLMCSPKFDRNELGRLREVIWHAQSMGRIGNLVSTWQREIADRDFTSGVFARALRQGDLTPDDLRSASAESIEAAVRRGGHEQYFFQKWETHRRCILGLAPDIHSVDVGQLLGALTQLMDMEIHSRGLK